MRPFKLMPLFSIIFVLGGLPFVPSNYVYAGCCSPCTCYFWCWCAGVNGCYKYNCSTDDAASLLIQAIKGNERLDVSGFYGSSQPPATRSYSIDRMIARAISGRCDKQDHALKLFQSAENRLKFEQDFLNYNVSEEDNNAYIVAKQMP